MILSRIDEFSATPKYQQLINAVLKGIEQERLKQNDVQPSINDLSFELDISRDTAEKGYRYLKNRGTQLGAWERLFYKKYGAWAGIQCLPAV